ncbi:hypothetical protein GH5_02504 [Leishmania sp. Ghana 2012 LV757]|uniref:hypothetical protein n=1 Tax=Leishmania sp. Ghana 2012 LV757 TaxID=2803181 RepID=UPI001B47A3FD|nr:hypothetical protein GH5_02504 [Leishmania sp. Ghana 2012 LV757]
MASAIQRVRHVEVAGLMNLRNLGGYHTNNSAKTTKWGVVYRSDQLCRVPAGVAQEILVDQVRIRHVYDLRDEAEVSANRYSFLGMRRTSFPIGMSIPDRFLKEGEDLKNATTARGYMQEVYRGFVHSYAPVLGRVIKGIVDSNASLLHCTAGKDRTGWICYVLLTLLDVTERKRADYLLTNAYVGVPPDAWDYDGADGMSAEAMEALWTAYDEYLDAALDELEKLGGVYRYAKTHMGLTDEDIGRLRELMLD